MVSRMDWSSEILLVVTPHSCHYQLFRMGRRGTGKKNRGRTHIKQVESPRDSLVFFSLVGWLVSRLGLIGWFVDWFLCFLFSFVCFCPGFSLCECDSASDPISLQLLSAPGPVSQSSRPLSYLLFIHGYLASTLDLF